MDGGCFSSKPTRSLPELEAEITELAGHLNAGNYRFLVLIAEFDTRNGWADGMTQSCAHWLNWKCGIGFGAAREKVRVAHALEKLPKISAAMERGQLSYSKVRALTRIAAAQTEEPLLMIALHGTAEHVEKTVRLYRHCEAQELSREERQQANRGLNYYHDEDGSLVLKGRLPAEIGALFIKAIDILTGKMLKAALDARKEQKDVPAGTSNSQEFIDQRPSFAARRADALGQIAESFLAQGTEAMNGGDRHQIVIHVSAETLRDSTPGQCELEEGPSLPAETVRRMACDASIVTLIENEQGEPLNVGRKTRSIPPALRRALNARDKGCRFPGCANTKYVDAHHIHHWAQGGETKASNLVTLCRFHHRKVHEGGITIQVLDDGALRFIKPNGKSIDSGVPGHTPPITDWTQLTALNSEHGIHIDKRTAVTRWQGETLDYGIAIEGMLYRVRKARDVSAGTSAVTTNT